MDLEQLEALALGDDRPLALSRLLPGSPEYDYWHAIQLQHQGRLDAVDELLGTWWKRHGRTGDDHARLKRRQLLLRAGQRPEDHCDEIRRECGITLDDQAEAEVAAHRYPTKLDPKVIEDFARDGLSSRLDLNELSDQSLVGLVARGAELDPSRRRQLLSRVSRANIPGLVALLALELDERSASAFNSLALYRQLTLAQLVELAGLRPALQQHGAWVDAVLARLRPPAHIDTRDDLRERALWLEQVHTFVSQLSPTFNPVKAQVLYHLLDLDRKQGNYDRARFLAYLALPRQFHYVSPTWLRSVPGDRLVKPASNHAPSAGLEAVTDDEPLVREYLHEFLQREGPEAFSEFLRDQWLDEELSTTKLLSGAKEAERWSARLGASRLAALSDRVEIELTARNPERLAAEGLTVLEVDVKNVRELVVKVFRINVLAYFQARGAEPDTSIDLDGMVASAERTLRTEAPALLRVRHRIELPEASRPGTYVVELIGNGRSSRALLRKGSLRYSVRVSVAGPVVQVYNGLGHHLHDAKLWLGGREYSSRDDGGITLPFSTRPGAVPMLLMHGDLCQREVLEHPAEVFTLSAGIHIERETLVAGRTARVILRPMLTVAGWPATVAVLEEPRAEITVTDRKGTAATRSEKLSLRDDSDTVLEVFVPEGAASVSVRLRGRVRIASTQQNLECDDGVSESVNGIHATPHTESLHLADTASGHVLSLLGKSGEARARRGVSVVLQHSARVHGLSVTLETDARGRIELGALKDVERLSAHLSSGVQGLWTLLCAPEVPAKMHVLAGATVAIQSPPGISGEALSSQLSLHELRGGVPRRDATEHVTLEGRALVLRGLEPGLYELKCWRSPRTLSVTVLPAESSVSDGWATSGPSLTELSPSIPVIRSLRADAEGVTVELMGAGPQTRVHLVATRYLPQGAATAPLSRAPREAQCVGVPAVRSHYTSGRDIGEEYRYVLERRGAARRPGVLLEKPGLLLNPWALRSTSSAVQRPTAGGAYAPSAQRPPSAPMGFQSQSPDASSAVDSFVSFDHHKAPAAVLTNLRPDAKGVLRVPRAELGEAQRVRVFVVDPAMSSTEDLALDERPWEPRDLRLRLALDPTRHFSEDRRVDPVTAGTEIVVEDIRTGRLELVDTLARAHQVLLALTRDETLRDFAFVTGWHALDEGARRALYSKYACHELHLFLHSRDPDFFTRVVSPYLASKRTKTFIDRWLLGEDLGGYASAFGFSRLNTLEKVLLARRIPALREVVSTLVGDAVDLQRRDPEREARLLDTLLGAAVLEAGGLGGEASAAAMDLCFMEEEATDPTMALASLAEPPRMHKQKSEETRKGLFAGSAPGLPRAPQAMAPAPAVQAPPLARPVAPPSPGAPPGASLGPQFFESGRGAGGDFDDGRVSRDLAARRVAEPLYRGADKTQEWAESDWWHRRASEAGPGLIPPGRFWQDLASHTEGPFLSPHLGDCVNNASESLCALAFLSLPFVAAKHDLLTDETRLTLVARSHCLAARTRLVEGSVPPSSSAVLVGQSYFRADDRWEWDGAEQREKYVLGEFLSGVVYQCQVVVTNPTSAQQRLDVLLQIPRGSVPVSDGFLTRSHHVELGPYGTDALEYSFYFPSPGRWSHFPAQVSRAGALVAAAPSRIIDVVAELSAVDKDSWAHVSQRGSEAEVLGLLGRANLGRVDLGRIAWRMKDRGVFTRVTALLVSRGHYHDRLWAYSLRHGARERLSEWLSHQDAFLRVGGPVLEGALVAVDATDRGWYEHLEYSPLVNARAHQLGARRKIMNDALEAQYREFLALVAHRRVPTDDDRLASAHYLFSLDRTDDALGALSRVRAEGVTTKLQYDYLLAYAKCCQGELDTARLLIEPWREHPVDRWRTRFAALGAMLDEALGDNPSAVLDADHRELRMGSMAAKQPSLELAVALGSVALQHDNLEACELRFYRMDIELLFSRQPFVQGEVERFSWIDPGCVLTVSLDGAGRTLVPLPEVLGGKNLVIEATAQGLRKIVVHYAHDLASSVAQSYGRVRVLRASTQAPLPGSYVKVYARQRGGAVAFYKDGYTDLCGRFDYATLSTDELDRVERFALLVVSDEAGAMVLETPPPQR